jgi:hypothetical protein
MTSCPTKEFWRLSRRRFLVTGTGLAVGLMFGAPPFPAAAQGTTTSEAGFEDFMRLSTRLTGRDDLLPAQGRIAFDALSARFPGFREGLTQLTGFMDVEVFRLQAALDKAGAEFGWIPREIVSAWYLDVVGALEVRADAESGLMPPAAIEGTTAAIRRNRP